MSQQERPVAGQRVGRGWSVFLNRWAALVAALLILLAAGILVDPSPEPFRRVEIIVHEILTAIGRTAALW
jgi:hypothetical protein